MVSISIMVRAGFISLMPAYGSRADHYLEVYIGMPDVILCLTENRPFDTCGPCLTVNGPILNLFRMYRHGSENVSPTGFFFSAGRVEGLKTWSEQAGMSLERPPSESLHRIRLRFGLTAPGFNFICRWPAGVFN